MSLRVCSLTTILLVLTAQLVFSQSDRPNRTVLWVDSYHAGYAWSDSIEQGIISTFRKTGVNLVIHRMNTKSCSSETCMEDAAKMALAVIEKVDPEVIIASDDNAQKFLVVPYLKDSGRPIVFCGVNWDASIYGYPDKSITGMVEVELIPQTLEHLQRFAKGNRVGCLSGDTASDRKNIDWLNLRYFNNRMISYRVKTFDDFKKRFIQLQSEVDMMFFRNNAAIEGFDDLEAKKFISKHSKIPTASNNNWMAPYVVFTLGKLPEEQGQYAAETALKILNGAAPSNIPVTVNKKVKLTANIEMAEAAGIVLPLSVLRVADVIGKPHRIEHDQIKNLDWHIFKGKRVVWIDSYHKGYEWSDGIERAIREVFFETDIELTILRMDTKRNNSTNAIVAVAKRTHDQLRNIKPDLIIASDDNVQKHVIVPHYRETSTPVVFCGVNMDASEYGYPASNVTGMVEVNPVVQLIHHLQGLSQGNRIGYIAGNTATERRIATIYHDRFFGENLQTYFVDSWEEFEDMYLHAQQQVDVLFFSNYTGIKEWDTKTALKYIHRNTIIPTGSDNPFMTDFVISTFAKSSDEQGRHAAITALKILAGEDAESIPIVHNKDYSIRINLTLAQAANIIIPVRILKDAHVLEH